eukprot:Polyplicarium_translucidae@DN1415_c0_g1_i1.p1
MDLAHAGAKRALERDWNGIATNESADFSDKGCRQEGSHNDTTSTTSSESLLFSAKSASNSSSPFDVSPGCDMVLGEEHETQNIHDKHTASGMKKSQITFQQLTAAAHRIYGEEVLRDQRIDLNISHILLKLLEKNRVVVDVAPDVMVVVGMSLPSIGSCLHSVGICKPCVFANKMNKACRSGHLCLFCHYSHKERRRRKKSGKAATQHPTARVSHFEASTPLVEGTPSLSRGHSRIRSTTKDHCIMAGNFSTISDRSLSGATLSTPETFSTPELFRSTNGSADSDLLSSSHSLLCNAVDDSPSQAPEWKDFFLTSEDILPAASEECAELPSIWPAYRELDCFSGSDDLLLGFGIPAAEEALPTLPTLCNRRNPAHVYFNETWACKAELDPIPSQQELCGCAGTALSETTLGPQSSNGDAEAAFQLCQQLVSMICSPRHGL